jgi:hypothetical protein
LAVAKKRTADADMKMNDRGQVVDEDDAETFGDNVLIVDAADPTSVINRPRPNETDAST